MGSCPRGYLSLTKAYAFKSDPPNLSQHLTREGDFGIAMLVLFIDIALQSPACAQML